MWSPLYASLSAICTGVLLDDLLVAEDLAAAETTSAALHLASMQASIPTSASNPNPASKPNVPDVRHKTADGAVIMGSPVAAPVNGDTTMDISTENAISHGHRYAFSYSESLFVHLTK